MAESQQVMGPVTTWDDSLVLLSYFRWRRKTLEQWEVKFLGYLKLRKLNATILVPEIEEFNEDKILGRIKYRSKQCGQRPDCSYRSSLIWVHTVCHRDFLNISADEKSRRLLL